MSALDQSFLPCNYKHLRKALTKCKYPKWALGKGKKKISKNSCEDSNTGETTEGETNNPSNNTTRRDPNKEKHIKGHIVIPYTQGLGMQQVWYPDSFKREQDHEANIS